MQVLQGEGGTVQSLLSSTASLTHSIADLGPRHRPGDRQPEPRAGDGERERPGSPRADQLDAGAGVRLAQDREPIGNAISSIGTLTQVTGSFLEDARPALRDDVRHLGDLATQLDQGRPKVERFLEYAPFAELIARVGLARRFNFYLCGLDGTVALERCCRGRTSSSSGSTASVVTPSGAAA
ncbi:hypothetical protein HBB16_06980 [Pseudonocardia sp. MCCB 268]|nr:hypothetical protein [Pseudonocardia cytotoxica]